ncbi:MAG: tetratricopeptide repeat protein, partial [Paracoccaceae bacterium]|nr:tetratricopeptide repeat protein [Paracoccaceae bacterium]
MNFFLPKIVVVAALCLMVTGCYKSSEERAAEHFESGLKLVENGDLPRAMVEFRNTLKYDEDNLEAFRQMARAHLALDEIPAAYGAYLRVVEQAPEDVEGRIALSELAFEWENWEEFERHSDKLAEVGSDLPRAGAIAIGAAFRQASHEGDDPAINALITRAEDLALILPESVILQRIRIDGYVRSGRYDAALAVLDASLARTPRDLDLYLTKLGLLDRLNDPAELEATLSAMLANFPENQTAKETYLRFLVLRERLPDAETFLEQNLASVAPEEQNGAFFGLITFLRETKGDDFALARIDAALAGEQAQNQILQTLRATLIFEMGQRDEAITAITAILAAEPRTMTEAEVRETNVTLAKMHLANGFDAGGREIIQSVLAEEPGLVSALKVQAAWLIEDDDTTAAINNLRLVLDSQPDDVDAMVLMANAYQRAGNQDLRREFLARATEASNNAPRYALLLGLALMDQDQLLQAESALISSLRLAPGHVEILKTLGQIYLRLDDLPRSDHVARTLAKIETDQAQIAARTLNAELVGRRLGVDEALQYLEQQSAQDGDATASTLTIIQAQLRTGRLADAMDTARNALETNPNDLSLRSALALSYASAGDFEAAENEYRGLITSHPEAIEPYLQLARIKAAQGAFGASAAAVEEGLSAIPDAPELLWAKASYL